MILSRATVFLLLSLLLVLPIHSIQPPTVAAAAMPVSFRTVAKGSRSGIEAATQIVVRNQANWASLWQKHSAPESNPPAAPAIDFSKEIVVAIFLGQKTTGGYAVAIVSVERRDSTFTVTFRETTPQPGGITTQAFTQPFHIVRVGVEGTPEVRFRRAP